MSSGSKALFFQCVGQSNPSCSWQQPEHWPCARTTFRLLWWELRMALGRGRCPPAAGTFAGRKSKDCSPLSHRPMTVYLRGPAWDRHADPRRRGNGTGVPRSWWFLVQKLIGASGVHRTRRLVGTQPDLLSFGKPKHRKRNSPARRPNPSRLGGMCPDTRRQALALFPLLRALLKAGSLDRWPWCPWGPFPTPDTPFLSGSEALPRLSPLAVLTQLSSSASLHLSINSAESPPPASPASPGIWLRLLRGSHSPSENAFSFPAH